MKSNFLKAGVAAAGLILLGAYFGSRHFAASQPPAPAVAHLLSLSMPDAKGQPQALSQLKDKILVVNFWATWCAPCVKEMPELSALQTEVASKNIQLVGIGIDSASNIAEFASKYAISYPLYVAGMNGSELSRQFGNDAGALPFTVLIGKDGQVIKTYLGRLKMEELRADISVL
jgi:thiol-disulfide isomerase/thioredoxin